MSAPFRIADIPDFSAPPPGLTRLPAIDPVDALPPTLLVIREDKATRARFFEETTCGRTFKAVCRDLADAQIPSGFCLYAVHRIDVAKGASADVTVAVLNEVVSLCEAANRSSPRCLDRAFEAHGIEPALDPDDDESATDAAPIHAAHRRGADVLATLAPAA